MWRILQWISLWNTKLNYAIEELDKIVVLQSSLIENYAERVKLIYIDIILQRLIQPKIIIQVFE